MALKKYHLLQLPYRDAVVYGPIQSRRLGWSLGINLFPVEAKVCNYDCVYCQLPQNTSVQKVNLKQNLVLPLTEIESLIEKGIRKRLKDNVYFDSITLSGNGDPSMYPDLLSVAQYLRGFINRLGLDSRLSIFTNAFSYNRPEFIEALRLFDHRLVKLDAADEKSFLQVNKPKGPFDLNAMAVALAQLEGIAIQTMVITGLVDNRESILSPLFTELVKKACATEVQLLTIDKNPAYRGISPVSEKNLRTLAKELAHDVYPISVNVYHQDHPSGFSDVAPPLAGDSRFSLNIR